MRASAAGLSPGKTVDLSWGTVSGGWVIEDYYHFRGKKYSETTTRLGQFTVDASGRLNARFVIPEDYGGVHEVTALVDAEPVAQNAVNVMQTFALAPTSGPVGTPIESPVAALPRPQFTFHTTPGGGSNTAYAEPYQPQPIPKAEVQVAGATLALRPSQGPVGARAVLTGEGFAPGERLRLVWNTSVGSRVSGDGFAAEEHALGDLRVGADGRLEWPRTIPEDLGGLHALTLRRGADLVARTHFVIETSIAIGAGTDAGDDSLEGRRLDRVRQHLRGDLRQRLYGLRVRLQQPGGCRDQLHGGG